jgi:hypothetical protein
MLSRGRKSSASTVVQLATTGRPTLSPPPSLTKEEKAAFVELVSSVDHRHLSASDLPLVVSYIQSSIKARKLARNGSVADWERATRTQMALARSLRLTVQSRSSPKTLARRQAEVQPSYYDLMTDDDDEANCS